MSLAAAAEKINTTHSMHNDKPEGNKKIRPENSTIYWYYDNTKNHSKMTKHKIQQGSPSWESSSLSLT